MVRIHSSFFRAENAQIIILFEIPGKGVAGRKGGQEELLPQIKQGLEKKLDAMVMRELYTKYKTAPTEEEKEKARKEYLDRRGVPESFRW